MASVHNDMSNSTALIPGGYYIVPRWRPEIRNASPVTREIYDFLVAQANYEDRESSGRIIGRGQCVRTYEDIQEGLVWYVGYRKMRYSKDQIENALKWLEKHKLITKMKTTRGLIITVVDYDFFQTPANYEHQNENQKKTTTDPQSGATINKEVKERKEKPIVAFSGLSTGDLPDFFLKNVEDLAGHEKDIVVKFVRRMFRAMCLESNPAKPSPKSVPRDEIILKLIKNRMSPAQAVNFLVFYNAMLLPSRKGNESLSLLKCFSPSNVDSYYAEWKKVKHLFGNGTIPETGTTWWKNAELKQIERNSVRKEIIRHYRSECKRTNVEPIVTAYCRELVTKKMGDKNLGVEDAKNLISFAVRRLSAEEDTLSLGDCFSRYTEYRSAWEKKRHLFENRDKPVNNVFWWKE